LKQWVRRWFGQVFEGNRRRFPLQIRFESDDRDSIDQIRRLTVGDAEGHVIPLSQLTFLKRKGRPRSAAKMFSDVSAWMPTNRDHPAEGVAFQLCLAF
jgi:Cu/Ag efflux pump CusA